MKKSVSFQTLKGISPGVLCNDDIIKQRALYGSNEIVEVSGNPLMELFLETFKDPMIWFLLIISCVFVLLGEKQEAFILSFATVPLIFMDSFLHRRTQISTASLKGQLATEAIVFRNDKFITINSVEIVPGDLVRVSSNEYLPADGIFEETEELQIDESALTGEAFPIIKKSISSYPFLTYQKGEAILSTDVLGYAGTRVLRGQGILRILQTGKSTSYGEIVQSVASVSHERTALQKSISDLVKMLTIFSGLLCIILAAVRIYQGKGWLDAFLSAATLAVAAIPEEFPVVFTFFLGVGVYRLAKQKALVRKAVSVENIGRVNIICSDKTGTITLGQLKLTHLDSLAVTSENDLLLAALHASDSSGIDPVDQAILEFSDKRNLKLFTREIVFPFTEDRKREAVFAKMPDGSTRCYVKGSPETILSRSTLATEDKKEWMNKTLKWAREGHKVLAAAFKDLSYIEAQDQQEPHEGFHFLGLMAFEDPPRPEVFDAISYCKKNNIRVIMITGDHPETARAIARDVGIGDPDPVVMSAENESERFEEGELRKNAHFLENIDVISRCTPLQKFRIVNALKATGKIIAVTGDGVNDVPALKAADIGIAMGLRGTRSAREIASIILADDNFSTIVHAIKEGKQLFFNLRHSFEYLLYIHIPFVVTAALIPFLGHPILYLPVHIVWLEIIIHPTALFAFQQETKEGINKTPNGVFFTRHAFIRILLIGLGLSLALLVSYRIGFSEAGLVTHGRSKAMVLLTFWSAGLVIVQTKLKNMASLLITTVTILSTILLIEIPFFSRALHLGPLSIGEWLILTVLVVLFLSIVAYFEKTKLPGFKSLPEGAK
jgi:Ca2+-transporting ATPase